MSISNIYFVIFVISITNLNFIVSKKLKTNSKLKSLLVESKETIDDLKNSLTHLEDVLAYKERLDQLVDEAFKAYAKQKKEEMSKEEFIKAMTEIEAYFQTVPLTDKEIDETWNELDSNKNNFLDKQEFREYLKNLIRKLIDLIHAVLKEKDIKIKNETDHHTESNHKKEEVNSKQENNQKTESNPQNDSSNKGRVKPKELNPPKPEPKNQDKKEEAKPKEENYSKPEQSQLGKMMHQRSQASIIN